MASLINPQCAVPHWSWVDDPVGGAARVNECSRVEARVGAGVLWFLALLLAILALAYKDAQGRRTWPMWPALALGALGAAVFATTPWFAARGFLGLVATFQASGLTKDEWIRQNMETARARIAANATLSGASLLATSINSTSAPRS